MATDKRFAKMLMVKLEIEKLLKDNDFELKPAGMCATLFIVDKKDRQSHAVMARNATEEES